ncbi:MBL fold metallo-hydrolase [Hyalangium versicolor]|uniref:MBL fold metallo-hydrolase n=1 Tax=Hyalangium versicolor TaxID=2861190 RepID=UPI001CCC1D66|nr:MBL fold metallo-hydrolase [Hyalangium versicolor]
MAKDSPSRLARALFIFLGLVLLGAAWLWPQLPKRGGERIAVEPGLTGVLTQGYSYAWVLKTAHGALLVDAGANPSGRELLAELAAQGVSPEQVHTVLLTHGHVDHWAAAHLFPQARVLAGPGEASLMRGQYPEKSLVGRLTRSMARPPLPAQLGEVEDGQELDLDGEKIRVIALPGHTPGSVAYLWKDVLFVGDTLVRSNRGLALSPFIFSEDNKECLRSLHKLRDVDFSRVADGHAGLTVDAKEQVLKLLK